MDVWRRAIERREVAVLGESGEWRALERLDQWRELSKWAHSQPLEPGWLHLRKGVPLYFLRRNGAVERLAVCPALRVGAYNALASTHDGDPNALSVFERELTESGKYRYWRHRRNNVVAAFANVDVMGACEMTKHMTREVAQRASLTPIAFQVKPGEADGTAVFVNASRIAVHAVRTKRLLPPYRQIAVLCELYDKVQRARFVFVMLHLKSDGLNDHGSLESVRVEQARALRRMLAPYDALPVVIAGDLNSDRLADLPSPTVLDVFPEYASVLPLQPTYWHFGKAAFDHILVAHAHAVRARVPQATQGPLPSARHGSDHLPVYADLILRRPSE